MSDTKECHSISTMFTIRVIHGVEDQDSFTLGDKKEVVIWVWTQGILLMFLFLNLGVSMYTW